MKKNKRVHRKPKEADARETEIGLPLENMNETNLWTILNLRSLL
jgi:hypothetical protein